MQAVNYGMKGMAANVKLAEAMGETTKTMGQMNKVMDPMKIAKTMSDFEQANTKMSMTEETSTYFLHLMAPLKVFMFNKSLTKRIIKFFISVSLSFNLIVNDALDDIMADSDDESEEQAVIDKVLDEIGIEISGKVMLN